VRAVPDPESDGRGLVECSEDEPTSSEGGLAVNVMTWIRILLGAIWLNGAAEKILNPQFPVQFARSLEAGGFVSQAPPWFQSFMQGTVVPDAELFASLIRVGELALGLGLLLGLLTNLAALGSMAFSLTLLLSEGGLGLGTGLGPPEFLTINLVVALLSLVVLLASDAKGASLDRVFSRTGKPGKEERKSHTRS
jgi:thiosulfate dehydrogenase [quinone] large subunit